MQTQSNFRFIATSWELTKHNNLLTKHTVALENHGVDFLKRYTCIPKLLQEVLMYHLENAYGRVIAWFCYRYICTVWTRYFLYVFQPNQKMKYYCLYYIYLMMLIFPYLYFQIFNTNCSNVHCLYSSRSETAQHFSNYVIGCVMH